METVEMISKLIGAAAALIAVITGVFGVCTYFRDSRRKLHVETMEAYKRLQNEVFDKLNDWKNDCQVAQAIDEPGTFGHTELNNALARIEHFCVGMNRGVYDFETFYQMSHGYFDNRLQVLLRPLLEKKGRGHGAAEDYYNNLHKVWARMEKRSKRAL